MNLRDTISEMQYIRTRVDNAYYGLLNLRNCLVAAQEEGKTLPEGAVMAVLNNALKSLEEVVEK